MPDTGKLIEKSKIDLRFLKKCVAAVQGSEIPKDGKIIFLVALAERT